MTDFSNTSLNRKRFTSRGGVVAVIISFLLGFVFAFAAVAGTIYYVTTSITVKDGIEKIGGLTGNENLDYKDYISEEYAEKTLLQLITEDVVTLVGKAGDRTLTLNDVDAISPLVGTKIEAITDMLQNDYGISVAATDFMGTSLSGMGSFLSETINAADLGQLLSSPKINIMVEGNGNYDLLMAICYGDASHYDIVDGKVVMKEGYSSTKIKDFTTDAMGVLEKAPLDKVLSVNADSDVILLALCYGGDYEIAGGEIVLPAGKTSTTLGDLINAPSDVLSEIELGTVMQLTGSSDAITLALAYGKKGVDYDIVDNKIVPVAGGKEPTTIGDLMGESEFFDDLKDTLTLGELLTIDESSSQVMQTLKDKTLNELTQDKTINGLKLGELLEIDETDPTTSKILIALKNNTVEELGKQETINGLKLGDLIEINASSSKILVALQDKTVADLNNQDTINGLKLGDLIEINSSSSKILVALQEKTVADLNNQDTINNLKLGDLIEINSSSSKILVALQNQNTTVADLNNQETINGLKLEDVMTINASSPRIIQQMATWTIADLSGSGEKNIETDLTLTDILGEEAMTGNLLGNLKTSTIGTLADDINNLTVQQVMGDDIYVDPNAKTKVLKGTWKYLLQDKTTGQEGLYKVTEMSLMIDNMTYNMQNASINDLSQDGIIVVDSSFCTQTILYEYKVGVYTIFSIPEDTYNGKQKIGELTVTEMLHYLGTVIGALSSTP